MSFDHTYASAIVGAQKTHKRKEADFYPSPPEVTEALLEFLRLQRTSIWEPACGDGAMSKILLRHGHKVISTDLREDSGYGAGGQNFLASADKDVDWIITNPPFNLAEAFIRKSLSITSNVAMLLKSQYWHAASRMELFHSCQPAWILPLTWRPAFLEAERGSSPLMDVMWVVWRNAEEPGVTKFIPLPKPKKDDLL